MKAQYKKFTYSLQGHEIHQKQKEIATVQPTERNAKRPAIPQTQRRIHSNNGTLFPVYCGADETLYYTSKDQGLIPDNINQDRQKIFAARDPLDCNITMDIEDATANAQVPDEVEILTASGGPGTSPI